MPLLGARGGGSVRGFGRFGKNLLLIVTDSFARTVSGLIGTSSDGKAIWTSLRGTWASNGSAAASASAAANKNLATIELDGSNIVNLQADIGTSGGLGVSFWVTDANSYYSLYPSYSTSTVTTNPCNGYRENAGWNNGTGMCSTIGNFHNLSGICYTNEPSPGVYVGYQPISAQLAENQYQYMEPSPWVANTCGALGKSIFSFGSYARVTAGYQTTTVVTTTYNSTVNLEKTVSGSTTALVSSNYVSNTSGFSKAQSVAISTSGDTISYSLYSSSNKGGSVIASGTNTPSSPLKGLKVGLFHGASTVDQGTAISNFKVEVTP
jgi:hypothetical protein